MIHKTLVLFLASGGLLLLAQSPFAGQPPPGFCPPAGAKVDPPIFVVDDICNASPANSFRLQEQAPPLSFRQKAAYFAQNKIFSGSAIFGAAFFGGISQLRDEPPQWPQGAQGFGYQFGTRYAQSLTKSTAEMLFGFREDPRPNPPPQPMVLKNGVWVKNTALHNHRPANASFGGRLGRALLGVIWTHYDSGNDGVAFSRITGAFAAGVVGRAWTPDPENTWGQVGVRTASAFGGYAASAVFHEFEPDLTKLFARITGQSKTPSVGTAPPNPSTAPGKNP
jgi:hypothetical protein